MNLDTAGTGPSRTRHRQPTAIPGPPDFRLLMPAIPAVRTTPSTDLFTRIKLGTACNHGVPHL